MKKVLMMFAAAMLTATVSAQNTAVTANKFSDNWYLGINGGITSTRTFNGDNAMKFKGLAPNFGLRVGKNLTTVFGLALEGNAYFKANEKSVLNSKTFINATVVNLLGTFNLSNLFGGYQGEPRTAMWSPPSSTAWRVTLTDSRSATASSTTSRTPCCRLT